MRIDLIGKLVVALVCCPMAGVSAQGVAEPRTVLAIFDSSDSYSPSVDNNLIHNNAEMVLNYLGLKVRYHDIRQGLPVEQEMGDVYGVITWFMDDALPQADKYCLWLSQEAKKGRKLVILGNFGAYRDSLTGELVPPDVFNGIFRQLGLEYAGDWSDNPFVIEVAKKDSRMVEFERTLEGEIASYERVVSFDQRNKVYLELNRTDIPAGRSAAVVIAPVGGYAMGGYEIFIDYLSDKRKWRIDPFLFFAGAFALEGKPRFDTTTLFGKRIFYSHVDGDGLRNPLESDRSRNCAQALKDEVLKKVDLPVTVSVISAEVDPRYYGSEEIVNQAREIFALGNVEAGAHGFTHLLDWQRQLTVFAIRGYSRPIATLGDLDILSESPYSSAMIISASREEMLKKEINGAVDYINRVLLPRGKKVAVYQWTGDCRPPAEAIQMVDDLGIGNINGGDPRFDPLNPSYTGVSALARQAGGFVQPYTSNANENIYTNGWKGPFYGFEFVIDTFRQTEDPTLVKSPPRRTSPINVYYHFYGVEKIKSLEAVRKVYDFALTQEIIPVFASEYCAIVKGFYKGKIFTLPAGGWRIRDYGACRTVRFDDCRLHPDLAKSRGVIGYSNYAGSLYVHLDESNDAELYLSSHPAGRVYLRDSEFVLSALKMGSEEISFTGRVFRKSKCHFANLRPEGNYEVEIKKKPSGKTVSTGVIQADRSGILEIVTPKKGEYYFQAKRQG